MKGKKLLAGILSAAMVLGTMAFPVFADETGIETVNEPETSEQPTTELKPDYSWYTADAEEYTISDVADLIGFSDISNGKVDFDEDGKGDPVNFAGKTVSLESDIDMSDVKNWLSIGAKSKGKFQGTFDGKGHTISNFTSLSNGFFVNEQSACYGNGFFGNLDGATIKNVTFDSAVVRCVTAGNVFGVAVAYSYGNSVLENISVTNSDIKGFGKVGGILGMAADKKQTTIKDCSVSDTTIDAHYDAGGIAGLVQGTIVSTGNSVSNVTFAKKSATPGQDFCEINTEITCTDSAKSCPGAGTKVKGLYMNMYGYYYGGYAEFYIMYGDSSHDCELKDETNKLANSEIMHDAVAAIGNVKYETLADAVAAAQDGATIKILSNVTESIEIAAGKNITLDLNGKTLTNTGDANTITNNGTLEIVDSSADKTGKVENANTSKAILFNAGGATATLNGGTFERTESKTYYAIKNLGTMIINKGVTVKQFNESSSAVANGCADSSEYTGSDVKLTINGGTFVQGLITIKNDECGVLEINGGSFKNIKGNYTVFNWNKAVINDGTFEANYVVGNGKYNDNAVGDVDIKGGTFNGIICPDQPDGHPSEDISISGGTFSTNVNKYVADGYIAVENDGKYTAKKSDIQVEDTAQAVSTTIALNGLEENLKTNHSDLFKDGEQAIYKTMVDVPSADDQTKAASVEKAENAKREMYDIKVVKFVGGVAVKEIPVKGQEVTLTLGTPVKADEEVKVTHIGGNGAATPIKNVKADGNKITFTAPSFSTYVVDVVPAAVTVTDIAENIDVKYENMVVDGKTATFDLVIEGADDKTINRFSSSEWTFNITDGFAYSIEPAPFVNITVPADEVNGVYGLNMNGKTYSDATGKKIKLAAVTVTGDGEFEFNATSAKLHAAKIADNIVTDFDSAATTENGKVNIPTDPAKAELTTKKYDLTVNIAFNNAVENNAKAYQDMTVTVSGGDLTDALTYELGSDNTDVAYNDGYNFTVSGKLSENNTYTVKVEGAGYRTARYTVTMTGNKTLNFWNNVMDNAIVVEEGNPLYTRNVTFLAGDIVKDNKINIYDLSAVVSYFGTKTDKTATSEYAKYDLNRDGVIDSKDVAYVLVSWGK
mgnify:CR=1 FL=1